MEKYFLKAEKRDSFGKDNSQLREKSFVPAVVYGKHVDSFPIYVQKEDFNRVFKKAGETSVIELEIDGKKHMVLVKQIQRTPDLLEPHHIEFLAVNIKEAVKATVEIEIVGENDLIKQGGIAVKSLGEIEIETLPTNIPHVIEVDISNIKEYGEAIRVKDLGLDKSIKVLTDEDLTVVVLDEVKEVVEEEETTEENKEEVKETAKEEKKEE
ncbi:MAG: 50S ribosomal protein L25 [Candidatus Pacebacteria bacterium]|nr:50S ribosomal protein L25 [Candidatus Paceibacterota bacterium]